MVKIALLGAAGQIGTPLSLLCKTSDLFDEIALYDIVHVPGIATDLMHIDTKAKVTGYLPADDGLKKALTGADVIVVTAGIARKPGMTRDDLFKTNAHIIRSIFTEVAATCPKAFCCVVTNPVNSTVPVAAKTLKRAGVFDPTRLFGVTTLDVVRASTFAAHATNTDPKAYKVPVIGGHSGATILPLYSQAQPQVTLDEETLAAVINRVQFGGDEIVKSKQGAGSATTCMAYAGFRFVKAILAARGGETVTEEAYVYLPGVPGGEEIAAKLGVDYFAVKVEIGKTGASKALSFGGISENESKLLGVAIEGLKKDIATGLALE
ncbi:malate dehydrogenase [Aspergillus vadensis CBS 113365]|uniref:malate dehydrogenase n=1 Tax=Aspergillus vadensis (strain CBS 113365 / IMI 142717 / IBT 24658) TaxID=1448311 RepID=A0A319CIJ6_ASPVC|nr:malate dehydrogenase [Aspergillus vadensis CBS 113365]PYH75208.1 malate dehydrogenase [Aspergillus vadensis CBS 113365]